MGFSNQRSLMFGAGAALAMAAPFAMSPEIGSDMRSGWKSRPAKKKRRTMIQIKRAKAQKAQRLARRKNR